jgi:hypothetical protein
MAALGLSLTVGQIVQPLSNVRLVAMALLMLAGLMFTAGELGKRAA